MSRDAGYSIDNVLNKLQGMKLTYARENIGTNPVSLLAHFTEFEAYTSILESHHAKLREQEEIRSVEVKMDEWAMKEAHDATATKPSEKMTQGRVDTNVEYRMREIAAKLKLLETEAKSCRNHVNSMQSILKNFGDQAKSIQ